MKKMFFIIAWLIVSATANAQGLPFFRNFSATEYQAHNRNFDITTDENGFVYVANFEGLLYYDNAEWRIIHTPHITRITKLYRDDKGTVWVGGYNYFGNIDTKPNGELMLRNAIKKGNFQGVVDQIWGKGQQLFIHSEEGQVYVLKDGEISPANTDIVKVPADNLPIDIGYGLKALATETEGVAIMDKEGNILYHLTEENGLCSNVINKLAYNNKGILWGATNGGLFCVAVPTNYYRVTSSEGLRGEVLSILKTDKNLYIGTNDGLFYNVQKNYYPITEITYPCWQMTRTKNGILVATSNGLYSVNDQHAVRQLNNLNTMSVKEMADGFYTGESDAVYFNDYSGKRTKIAELERVTNIYIDEKSNLWIQNLYGIIWCKKTTEHEFHQVLVDKDKTVPGMIVPTDNGLITVGANQTEPIPYPQFAYMDDDKITWLTNSDGHELHGMKDGKRLLKYDKLLLPISDYNVRDMFCNKKKMYMGGDFGLILIATNHFDPILENNLQLHIRTVKLNGDSILWGGSGKMPTNLPTLASNERNLEFTYALDNNILIKKPLFRYRMDNRAWSAWDDEQEAKFPNLEPGHHKFEVQSLDAYGTVSNPVFIEFDIQVPFYLRWYMNILYIILIGILVYMIIQYRLRRLEKEKMRLENIVQERTAEVVRQKDEIEEKSQSLEAALQELSNAQNELIRQEKMATVGKLTQGLIDRILNPLNYINNFSKLSQGLVKDIEANIEDEKENMDGENYEDTIDVLNMLQMNLQKVGEHGANTTRTLKAMEEMLKDRSGGRNNMDLNAILKQDEAMLRNYYSDDINRLNINISFNLPEGQLSMNGNAEQLSKTFMSILGNSVYALDKKAQRTSYQPEIKVMVQAVDKTLTLSFQDNGIGIEQTIIDKVFDPFFTTKPTGEASGVGLYLSREIVQNHGGDISVKSIKDEYTEVTITLPTL